MIVMSFLLFISFMLHIGTFWMVSNMRKKIDQTNNTTPREITELLDLYLEEIKEENKDLKEELQKNAHDEASLSNQQEEYAPEDIISPLQETKVQEEPPTYYEGNEDYVEASNEAKMLSLYNQGFTLSEIAKELHIGKTEVQLMLKFHRNE